MTRSINLKITKKSSYEISKDSQRFIINAQQLKYGLRVGKKSVDRIIEYSSLDNNIVKIYEMTQKRCVTEFHADLAPMVIIQENNFYEDQLFLERSRLYAEFITDFDRVSVLYNRIVDAYLSFIENTGCYFKDMSGNNILVDSHHDVFKIIDVFSIREVTSKTSLKFSPLFIMMTLKASLNRRGIISPGDKITNHYLSGVDLAKINDTVLRKINVRTFDG